MSSVRAAALPLRSSIKRPLSALKWGRVHDWTGSSDSWWPHQVRRCLLQHLQTLMPCSNAVQESNLVQILAVRKIWAELQIERWCRKWGLKRHVHAERSATCPSTVSDRGAEPIASFKSLVLQNDWTWFEHHPFLSWEKCSNVHVMAEYFFT